MARELQHRVRPQEGSDESHILPSPLEIEDGEPSEEEESHLLSGVAAVAVPTTYHRFHLPLLLAAAVLGFFAGTLVFYSPIPEIPDGTGSKTLLPFMSSETRPTEDGVSSAKPSINSPTISPSSKPQSATIHPTMSDPQTSSSPFEPRLRFYTVARTDRAGSAIKEMLLAHSYAFESNITYGGACVDRIDWDKIIAKHGEKFRKRVKERIEERRRLIEVLGLAKEIPLACPTQEDLDSGRAVFYGRSEFGHSQFPFPSEWFAYLQSKTAFQYRPTPPTSPIQVAVHMRRQDFTPCHVSDRYLPNIYYLEVLDYFLPKFCDNPRPCNVTIFTQSESYEPFDPFLEKNYTLDFETPAADLWRSFINADFFVMSMSAFSFVPATLNPNRVLSPYGGRSDWPWTPLPTRIWKDTMKVLHEQQIKEGCAQ